MKKLLFTLVLLLSSVVGNAQTFRLGDVNKDGQVTIGDVMMVVDIVLNGYKPLALSSENVVVDYGSSATVNISSGYGPYDITCSDENLVSVSLDGTQLSITGKAVGTAVVTVTDIATGFTKDITVTVNAEPLTISNHTVEVTAGESATVQIISGSGNYSVVSSNPSVATATVSNGIVTVISVAGGTATITVTDTQSGQSATIEVTVAYLPLALASNSVSLIVGDEGTVEITSGSGSYSVQSSDSEIATAVVDGTSVKVTAIEAGKATITVIDTKSGQTTSIEVTVDYLPLVLSSYSLTLSIGDEGSVNITSGSGNYSVESSDDNVAFAELDGNAVSILAFGGGSATITVTDTQSGQTATIEVTVDYLSLELSASSLTLTLGEVSTVNITSGNGFFTVRSSDTSIATASLSGTSIKVTAVAAGNATITVTDRRSGQTATIEVTVDYLPLELSASSLTLIVGEESTVNITSGSGDYSIEISDISVATATLSGTSVKVTAVAAGTAIITVTDTKSSQSATIEVTVEDNHPQSYLTCPDDHHPHLIDLGLPSGTKWACCNVDTDYPENQSPTNYGGYYAWGETETKSTYNWSTYIHCDGSYDTCIDLGSDIAGTEYDVAHVKWRGSWVMPSKEQQVELISNCTITRTTQNGVSGRLFTGTNGGSIFLPAAGNRCDPRLDDADSCGYYWSSTQYPSDTYSAYYLGFSSGFTDWYSNDNRDYGFSVRPVSRN